MLINCTKIVETVGANRVKQGDKDIERTRVRNWGKKERSGVWS